MQRVDRSSFSRVNDGVPSGLDIETFKHSLFGYGNAIVPQVALQIFKAIEQYALNK
jgi:hypothetical protein